MEQGPPRRRRGRPVGDTPVRVLVPRAEDLAKGWLLALLEQARLDEAGDIVAAEIAADGPRLCAAMVRALATDEDLWALEPGGELHSLAGGAARMVAAADLPGALRAVDALSGVIWVAVRGALQDPDTDQVSALAERLARVSEAVRSAALAGLGSSVTMSAEAPPASPARRVTSPVPSPLTSRPIPPPASRPRPGTRPGRPAESQLEAASGEAEPQAVPALWQRALAEEITRAERSGAPLSLLLVELDDAARLQAVESPDEAAATVGRFVQAVRTIVRRQDFLARETDARIWIIARDTAFEGAQALGERAVEAVRAAAPWRGAPLSVSVGYAVLGEDADDLEGLVADAEEGCYAAAAGGGGVARAR